MIDFVYQVTLKLLLNHILFWLSLHNVATDASLTADPGMASSIQAGSHTFVEIDHEIW